MIATIIKIQKKPSKWGGHFFYVFFKDEDGNSLYTCIYPKMRNWARWKKVMDVGTILTNLKLAKKNNKKLIDADSKFAVIEE